MVDKLQAWYNSHKGTSHAIAGALVTAVGAYATNAYGVQTFVNNLLKGHPQILALLAGITGLYLNYRTSQKAPAK